VASIIDLLVKTQLIDERQHEAVMSRTDSRTGGHIVQQVAELGYATEGSVARAISVELGLPRIDLAMTPAEPSAVALLDARTCAERFVLPVALRENGELLWLAMADPTDQEALGIVRRRTQKRVRPAVAGPTEILRAVRMLYAAPNAGTNRSEEVDKAKLAAIEIADESEGGEQPFEVVNIADDIEGSPLSRIARQLGVEVPAKRASSGKGRRPEMEAANDTPAPPIETSAVKAVSVIPPKTDPRIKQARSAEAPATSAPPPISKDLTFDELFTPVTQAGAIANADLSGADVETLEAVRAAMEKGALILRSLAELCVEKGVFTREEMKRRNSKE
jgi:hypothetical protein